MLNVDIHMSEQQLIDILQQHCAQFGTVKFVRVLPVAKGGSHRFAFVRMSTLAETMDLAVACGGSTLGSGAVALCLEATT